MPKDTPSELNRSLRLITVAGCLAMVYLSATTGPARTDFFRALGASDLHFGLLSGFPMMMLSLQFIGAYMTNRLPRRKGMLIVLLIISRLLYLPIAFLPLLSDRRAQTVWPP